MNNQYKELLKQQSVKRSLFFSIVDKAGFFKVLGILCYIVLSFVSGYALFFSALLENLREITPNDPEWSQYLCAIFGCLLLGALMILAAALAVLLLAMLIQAFIHLMFVEVPCRANRKYLPFTQDEIKSLNMDKKAFAEFCEYLCSRKIFPFCKETHYASFMMNDLSDLMKLYCDTYNLRKCEGHCYDVAQISQYFSEGFRDHIRLNHPWLL